MGVRKLTMAQANEIRTRYGTEETSILKLATEYDVAPSTIWHILHRITYVRDKPEWKKLSPKTVRAIRKSTLKKASLARKLGISTKTIYNIQHRRTYKDVE